MIALYVAAVIALAVSFFLDREKTRIAVGISWKRFLKILPMLVVLVLLTAAVLGFIPGRVIVSTLSKAGFWGGVISASVLGSITAIPGFVAFPLAGVLLQKGVSYTVLAAFTTTLMMVGVVTFPLERSFLGTKVVLVRNAAGFVTAIAVAFAIGIVFGEFLR